MTTQGFSLEGKTAVQVDGASATCPQHLANGSKAPVCGRHD